ncbi:hypothetical protein ACFY7H_13190 [Streptomyces sp. NPDC012794]|uniref:hypothetical protein n=1 Tax=Streptomyces sp. NPDC012794 TaxID=3364850 RepID=UPI0036A2114E
MTSEQLALWVPEPCHAADPAPARPRTSAADQLRALRERRIEPEAGRAAGGWRTWTPFGDDIRITTIKPSKEYL